MRSGLIAACLCLSAHAAASAVVTSSIRPVARPAPAFAAVDTAAPSIRPQARGAGTRVIRVQARPANDGFRRWLRGFRARALAAGIAPEVFAAAFRNVRYDREVIGHDRNQSEFTKTIWAYLDDAVSESRIERGRDALHRRADTLAAIEARYGVPAEVVTAVWGLESAYGTYLGDEHVIQALATLAYDGRRGAFFEDQLLAALRILQAGDVAPRDMTGSWAGAMGHTQFIPTSYRAYAVDFAGDGRRDIWSENPTDALASTAAYLAEFGWTSGQPWGVEVALPRGFDYTQAGTGTERAVAAWTRMGVRAADGDRISDHGPASILTPAGAQGAAFMIFENFHVIEHYNAADAYVIAVGRLSDRIAGAGPLRADWPRGERALAFAERKELQRRLTAAGFDTRGIDGRLGPNTTAAIRAYQRAGGLTPDGYASRALLERLR